MPMDVSLVINDDPKSKTRDPDTNIEQLGKLRYEAEQMFAEGNSLQALEYYSKILEIHPQDEKALQGRLAVCIGLKLFHRCLRDLADLTVMKPTDPKIHNLSGFVLEQIGEYEKSLSSYLEAYLLDGKGCLETAKKIRKICYLIDGHEEQTEGDCADTFEILMSLSKKLLHKGRFLVCFDMLRTALMVHSMDENSSKLFKQDLSLRVTKDKMKQDFSETFNSTNVLDCVKRESRGIKFLENVDLESINEALLNASECCLRLGRMHTSIWFAERSLENALFSENFMDELTALSKLAFLYRKLDQRELCTAYLARVLAKCRDRLSSLEPLDTSTRFQISVLEREALLELCVVFKELEFYQDAEKFAREYFLKVEMVDQDNLVKAYGILGEIERLQGSYEEAIKSHRTELALCQKFQDQRGMASAYGHLGKVHHARGQTVLATECHELQLKIATSLNDAWSQAVAYGCLGEEFGSRNDHQKALQYFDDQLRIATANNLRHLRCQALASLGLTYQNLKLFTQAESYLTRASHEAQELKASNLYKIKQSLIEIQLSLGKSNEALPLLLEVLDYLESKFHRMREYKIVTSHPLLEEFNRCLDNILELLAQAGRVVEALEFAERSNAVLLRQMLEYKSFVEGSDVVDHRHRSPSFTEIHQLVSSRQKLVLVYRVVKNGYMAWVLMPSHKGVATFHWHRAPPECSFRKSVEANMNGLLKPRHRVASHNCDHRKLHRYSSPEPNDSGETDESTAKVDDDTDFLCNLSKMFVFPVEEILDTDLSNLEMVVVKSAFLDVVPFPHLHTSSGRALHDHVPSVQNLPCISVLGIMESCDSSSYRPIRIIGNAEFENVPGNSSRIPGNAQSNLLEEELSDVSVLLGVKAEVGMSATKERFLDIFSSTSLLHLATYGSHDDGVIALAPVPEKDPRTVSDDSWAITLEDIVALRQGPDVVVLDSCYGCHHRFQELLTFTLDIPLAFMVAGVKTVVMPTWSVPQQVLLASLREFYKNLSSASSIADSLKKTKAYLQTLETFQEPFFWSSFNLYGCDSTVPLREIRRHTRESSFEKARETVKERFDCERRQEERSRPPVSKCLVETAIQILHRHHLFPDLLPILQDLVREAAEILQPGKTKESSSLCLPYREVTPPWLSQILMAERFLVSIGFIVKKTSCKQTIVIYPHWNDSGCLEKAHSLLQSISYILSHSPILADSLRVFLNQEDESVVAKFGDVLRRALTYPTLNLDITNQPLVRMFWVKPSTHRLMAALGFSKVGPLLDFRNSEEDKKALESCLKIFAVLTEFEAGTDSEAHPVIYKANLDASWMSHRASDEENKTKLVMAQRLDAIQSKYEKDVKEVKRWHNHVLETQTRVAAAQSQKQNGNDEQLREKISVRHNKPKLLEASTLPQIKTKEKETLDLTTFGGRLAKIKVESGSSPSCLRVPVMEEPQLPLIECVMKRHESYNALYRCLNDMNTKKREEVKKLVTL